MRLTLDQIIEYETNGYVIAEGVLSDADLQPVIDEMNAMIDERAKTLHAEGKIHDLHEDEPFECRLALLEKQCAAIGARFDIMYLLGEAMFEFLKNDNLLDVVECLLGSELSCNPIQHIRAKMPSSPGVNRGGFENVPWHQDAAVTSEDADASEIITFWIPLVDATEETGCMELIPGVSKYGYLRHQAEGGTTIVKELLPTVPASLGECRKGGIVIMNKYTPHRGLVNNSNHIRWSIDLRYHKTGAASGRSSHPSFVVRSKQNPQSVLDDVKVWRNMWTEALSKPPERRFHRV